MSLSIIILYKGDVKMLKRLLTGKLFPQIEFAGIVITCMFYLAIAFILYNTFGIIDETQRGVKITLGKAHEQVLQPGMYTKLPFITIVVKYDVRVIKEDVKMEAYTRDIQTAGLEISASFILDKTDLVNVYGRYGKQWAEKIIWNNLSQTVKDVVGQYDAENLIENREKVARTVLVTVNDIIKDMPAELTQFQLLNIDFSSAFEAAVEAKVIASQRAMEAENKTRQVEEEAKQKLISARAEAESMRIRSQALAQNRGLVDYEIATRWDGKLPTTVLGNTVPLLNLNR